MPNKIDGDQNAQSAKVLKLGFNISVSGDPGTDFEIVLDDKEQEVLQSSAPQEEQLQHFDALELESYSTEAPKHETEKKNTQGFKCVQSKDAIQEQNKTVKVTNFPKSSKISGSESMEDSAPQDSNIISKIMSTMEHFEKFSDHIKDIPRLRNCPLATSTPLSDKYNSRPDSSLMYSESRPWKYSHLYDFHSRKEYFKSSLKPMPPDLFLKPLPGEGYYTRGVYTRYIDLEPYRHYGSDSSLNKASESKTVYGKSSYDVDKQDGFPPEPSSGILKKSDSESGDKQSTSSADSVKDIKIYQSGGILIMQNFKDNMDASEKKEISEFSAKLIENCNKLKMEVSGFQENKLAIGNFSEETKNSGKMVQFDLSNFEKSKSEEFSSVAVKDESSVRMESSESTSDCMKNKDSSPQGTSQSQDFTSLSTQENDSIMSNPPGMSPNYASSKKLEWDSGADIGYLNLDLSKENLSTIEKIVLKGLSSDGMSEEKVVYEKKSKQNPKTRTKLTLERMHSDSAVEKSDEGRTADFSKKETEVIGEEIKSRNVSEERIEKISAAGNTKGALRFESEETKRPTTKSSAEETYEVKKKSVELTDSSVNVNTLFENVTWRTPPDQTIPKEFVRPSESPTKVTHRRHSHSSRAKVSKHKNRPSPTRLLKAPKKSTVGGSLVSSYIDMGNPKKVYKKVEASPVLNDVELSREVEEIIIDQRFKIKQSVAPGREGGKEPNALAKDKSENLKDGEAKSRPISASSSSNNTVLPKSDAREKMEEKTKTSTGCKFIDQMIQTSDCDCTSVSVQAFASQLSKVSSDRDFRGLEKKERKTEGKIGRENVNVSSKNIQAFGLNSSLPKQLEHPKEMELVENQHTKSTQYFGGPLNSLPNYHSKVVGKPVESCARAMNVLKQKRNSEAEIIRMKEENEKNILANDTSAEHKKESSRRFSNKENKENLITEKSPGSKRTQANGTRKNSGEFDGEKKESEGGGTGKGKKKSGSIAGSDGSPTSDDVSSLVLTSEVLKEHGDSIDRNIIQEKYFQSQLMELEKRKMISRSTSMEIQLQIEGDATAKEFMSTGCQYSPQSRGTSGGPSQEPEDESFKGNPNKKTRKRTLLGDRNPDGNAETGDSLPSSTQTAHSWVAGMRSSRENSAGVGKARSFEYLPGHIYESSGNLREELPSETERNLISNSTSDSDRTARGSGSNDGAGDSEGRHTLVLENSTEYSNESEQLKILDENLTQLNMAVTKLSEKDAQVENLTKSLLANFCRKTGSGDWLLLGDADSSKIEAGEKRDFTDNGGVPREAVSEGSGQTPKADAKEKEISIGCQTEEKSPSSDPGKFQVERKAFEKRISEEKKCQIKWIENEIYHLNVLRRLLESPGDVKKKRSFLSVTSNGSSKSEENDEKNVSQDRLQHQSVTPTYGGTIAKVKNTLQESSRLTSERSSPHPEETEPRQRPQYGVAVSLTGCPKNWQRVVMLPVGVQVSLKDAQSMANCGGKEVEEEKTSEFFRENSLKSARRRSAFQSDVETQYPSAKRESSNCPSTSIQADLASGRSGRCTKENCFCINLSDKSFSSSSRSKTSERKRSWGLHFIPEERGMEKDNQRGSATGLGFQELENYPENEKMRSGNRDESSDLCGSYTNSRTAQSGNCKCQNCPGRVSTPVSNSEVTPQPNVHLNRKKSSEFGTCSCTKIKICACKVNKIQGSKCCCTENISCLCKRQRPTKKTENQGCQTECESVITKDLVEYPEIKRLVEAPRTENVCEAKIAVEKKKGVEEKLPCSSRVSYEKVDPSEDKLKYQMKTAVKIGPPPGPCSCSRRAEKERARVDDHPRHYFLRFEETEVEDSMEQMKQKKSLEVVTVKIPVKKAGKSKIYVGNTQETQNKWDLPVGGCNCCAECAQSCKKPTPDYEPSRYRRNAERPESPTRMRAASRPPECDSYEEFIYSDAKASEQEGRFGGRYRSEQGAWDPEPRLDNLEAMCCQDCNCSNRRSPPSREYQGEYDSHKRKSSNVRENERFFESKRKGEKSNGRSRYGGAELDWSSEYRDAAGQGSTSRSDPHNPEYYNYNKREFMTKSELLKEEEQKRKVHQPSLQECLESNRPDFYNSAERRRQIISQRAKERVKKHNARMECLMKLMQQCNQRGQPSNSTGAERIFTTAQMKEQTMKRYRKLPEVRGKIADERKREEYRTNRLMADIFAKKLQNEALKGHINLSNSVSVLHTI